MKFIDFLDNLHEEFAELTANNHTIFKNPSSREMTNLIKTEGATDFRLLADKDSKEVHLFNSELIHAEAIVAITGKSDYSSRRWVRGYADKVGKIEEFYPEEEVLNVIDWADKNNSLTWPGKDLEKKRLQNKKEKFEKKQRELHIKLRPKKVERKKVMSEGIFGSILEEFKDYVLKDNGKSGAIFKNPSRKEISELVKNEGARGFRLILDKKKGDVYVFDQELLHHKAYSKIANGKSDPNRYYEGFANKDLSLVGYRVSGKNRHELQKELGKITEKKTPFKVQDK